MNAAPQGAPTGGTELNIQGKFAHWPRKSDRVSVDADVVVRRIGENSCRLRIYDISRHGCRVDFVTTPQLDDVAFVRFDGMESLEAAVCWVEGQSAGLEFAKPIHPAVFDRLVSSLS
jgi:hypothetical protein